MLGRFEGVHWSEVEPVSGQLDCLSPTAAADDKGGIYLAWSEWNAASPDLDYSRDLFRRREIYAARQRGPLAVGPFNGNTMRPAMAMESNGRPLIAYELGRNHHFELHTSTFDGKQWTDETIATKDNNFRPSIAVDKTGRTWLAWDRFTGNDYDVVLRSRMPGGKWSDETLFFATTQDEQRPTLRAAPDGTVWVHTARRVAGIRDGKRVEMTGAPAECPTRCSSTAEGAPGSSAESERSTRVRRTRGRASQFVRHGAWRSRAISCDVRMPLGYRAPMLDSEGKLWNATDDTIYRLNIGLPKPEPGTLQVREASALAEIKPPVAEAPHAPHESIQVRGVTYTLFFGEQHTHLGEHPTDRTIEIWPDRFISRP